MAEIMLFLPSWSFSEARVPAAGDPRDWALPSRVVTSTSPGLVPAMPHNPQELNVSQKEGREAGPQKAGGVDGKLDVASPLPSPF